MKLNLRKSIMLHEQFMNNVNEESPVVVDAPAVSREIIIKDVDTIINSLETLSNSIVEDLESTEFSVVEAGKEGPSKVADWLLYAGKFRKMQKRINQMKMNSADLQMAAMAEKDPNRKAAAKDKKEKHIFALESDEGGFTPRGFSFTASPEKVAAAKRWLPLLKPYGTDSMDDIGGGSDISPLNRQLQVPLCGFMPDPQRYFDYHHSSDDVFENVNQRELELGGASMAAMIYLIDTYWTKFKTKHAGGEKVDCQGAIYCWV